MGAAFEAADEFGWTLVHPLVTGANPSGRVTTEAFERFAGLILDTVTRGRREMRRLAYLAYPAPFVAGK